MQNQKPLLRFLSAASLLLFISLAGCKKDKDSPSDHFSATVNGTIFHPVKVVGYDFRSEVMVRGIQSSTPGDSTVLETHIPYTYVAGSTIEIPAVFILYYKTPGGSVYSSLSGPTHGSLHVDSWDHESHIAGSFEGVIYNTDATDSVVLTNCTFNTSYGPYQ